jgi:hypothetical protein
MQIIRVVLVVGQHMLEVAVQVRVEMLVQTVLAV